MGLLDVERQELRALAVFLLQPVEALDRAAEGRSGKAAED
jgi:hypothetical protein